MKYIFLTVLLTLLVASAFTASIEPRGSGGKPVIYWVSDANPARIEQIELFEKWMVKQGHVAPGGGSAVELRLDTANYDRSKKIIQSVSGAAGDVMDMGGGSEIRLFQSMGVLADLTEDARVMGFDPSHTFAAARDEIVIGGRQFAFPCNFVAHAYWVNRTVFEDVGLTPPTGPWTIDEFERIGIELCRRANANRPRREVFFCSQADYVTLLRSLGVDRFNETLTRCTLDDPRFVEVLKRVYKWTYVDHIMPTPEDADSMDAQQAGFGGNLFQLFNRGRIAMIYSGRYALIQFRQFNASRKQRGEPLMNLSVIEPPNGGLRNVNVMSRAAVVYRGSKYPRYAELFLAFLASKDYNMQIVRDGDSLPPDPAYTKIPEFIDPPAHPEESGLHEPWARLAETIAIPTSHSPFVLTGVVDRIQNDLIGAYMAGRIDAEQAARRIVSDINAEIELRLHEDPALRKLYEQRLIDQQRIDALRARGETVPLELIVNPFYRRYYVDKGWAR